MITTSRTLQIGALLLLAGLSLGLLYFVFEYKYMWYVDQVQAATLRGGYLAGMAVLVLLWIFYPNYVAVVVVGVLTLMFPVIFKVGRSTELSSWTVPFIILGVVCLLLLIGTAALRRRVLPQWPWS